MQWRTALRRCPSTTPWPSRKFSQAQSAALTRVPELSSWDVIKFRALTNNLQSPVVLPRAAADHPPLPATSRWFSHPEDADQCSLQQDYLSPFGDIPVPLELTTMADDPLAAPGHVEFRRTYAPLSLFLRWTKEASPTPSNQRIYLAQCQLMDLPDQLQADLLPVPNLVLDAGKGDIYDTNIWVGRAPTYTPLHRDPNPNLFYQLAGRKVVRMFPPEVGDRIFREVKSQINRTITSSSSSSASIRGDEMMAGAERVALEQKVWEEEVDKLIAHGCQEAVLDHGQALFIPLKWWHSIKGVGSGVTASINWWFR